MYYAGTAPIHALGQALIGAYFLIMLVKNLRLYRWNVERMGENGVPYPEVVLPVGFVIQCIGGVLVLIDYERVLGVVLLLVFTFTATAIFHRFWQMDDPMRRNYHMLLCLANVATTGGLLLVI
jgi:putative oxidoreductase